MLNTLRRRTFGDQRVFGGADHLRSAADQDLPVSPVAVFGDDVHQLAGLAQMQPARRRDVGIVGGPGGVAAPFGDWCHRQPGIVRGDLPQGRQVVELARVAGAEEHVHARVHPPAGEVHDDRAQRCEPGAAGHHQHVAAVAVDLQGAVRAGQPPPVPGLGLVDDGIADQAAGYRADVKLDGSGLIWRDGRCQISPPPRALRHGDVDVLARVVGHRAVQLQPDDGQVAGHPKVFDHRAVPPRRPLFGVGGAAHHPGDQVHRLQSRGVDGVGPRLGQLVAQRRIQRLTQRLVVLGEHPVLTVVASQLRQKRHRIFGTLSDQFAVNPLQGLREGGPLHAHIGRKQVARRRIGGKPAGVEAADEPVVVVRVEGGVQHRQRIPVVEAHGRRFYACFSGPQSSALTPW